MVNSVLAVSAWQRIRYLAWDHKRGLATGPHRSTHAGYVSGAFREWETCSGGDPGHPPEKPLMPAAERPLLINSAQDQTLYHPF